MKNTYLILISFIILLGGCTNKNSYFSNLLKELPNDNGKYRYYVVVPGGGCNGCISSAENFVKENYSRKNILFVFTRIESVKVLKLKLGEKICESDNVIIDKENKFEIPSSNPNSIYPAFISLDKNRVTKVNYLSPNEKFSLHSFQEMIGKEPMLKVDLASYFENKDKHNLQLSDLTEKIEYIPLKTPHDLPIGMVSLVKVTDDFIYCLDTKQQLFQFNKDGDFLRLIGKKGGGPDEYLQIMGFDVDEKDNVYMYDLSKRYLFLYSKDGQLQSKIKMPIDISAVSRTYDNHLLGTLYDMGTDGEQKLVRIDTSGTIVDTLFVRPNNEEKTEVKIDLMRVPYLGFSDQLYIKLPFDDIMYAMTPTGNINKYFELYQGKYKLPKEIASNVELYDKNIRNPYIFQPRTKLAYPYCFIDFFFEMNTVRLVYDFRKDQFFDIFYGPLKGLKGIKNDIDSGSTFWPSFVGEDYIAGIIPPHLFDIETDNEQTKKLYDSFRKYDNPVLQLIKLDIPE